MLNQFFYFIFWQRWNQNIDTEWLPTYEELSEFMADIISADMHVIVCEKLTNL